MKFLLGVLFIFVFLGGAHRGESAEVRQDVYLLRNHPDQKVYETLEVSFEKSEALGITTRVVRRHVHRGVPPKGLLKIKGSPEEFHFSLIEPDLEFVIPRYDRRGCGGKFAKKLRKLARTYLNDSIYVTVFDAQDRRVGAVRFIHRPYRQYRSPRGIEVLDAQHELYGPVQGVRASDEIATPGTLPKPPDKLPESNWLGVTLPMRFLHIPIKGQDGKVEAYIDQSLEWEVGNFALDETQVPTLRSAALTEIWVQFMRVAFPNPSEKTRQRGQEIMVQNWRNSVIASTFHAYADEKSLKLYLPLGFKYLREYEIDGQKVHFVSEEQPPPIIKEGTKWWPIVFYPESILSFNDKISENGFRGFNAQGLLARRQEADLSPLAEVDNQRGLSRLLSDLEGTDERVAATASGALLQLFEVADFYREAVDTAAPAADYDSNFNSDPMMAGFRTYCELLDPLMCMMEQFKDVIIPNLQRLKMKHASAKVRRRIASLLDRIGKIKLFAEQIKAKPLWETYPVEDPLADEFKKIAEIQPNPQGTGDNVDYGQLAEAVSRIVGEMKTSHFTALVLSGESSILSYSLVRSLWDKVGEPMPLPPVFVLSPEMNDYLKNLDRIPSEKLARITVSSEMPLLRPNGGNVLVLDDHAYTGVKFVRQRDFFLKAGLLNVTYGFIASHPDSLANRNSNITFTDLKLVQEFRDIGELIHSDKRKAYRRIGTLVRFLQRADLRCELKMAKRRRRFFGW